MNISFDLDGTLIPNGKEFETEKRGRLAAFFGVEEVRMGIGRLIAELQQQGHKIHIYTTSFRSKSRIRRTLNYYGISVSRIVNQSENSRTLRSLNMSSSKYPVAFKFDLHIDDSKGVGIEGERFNFKTIIVDPSDQNWTDKVLREVGDVMGL